MQVNVQVLRQSRLSQVRAIGTYNEKDHRSDRWSQKPQWLLLRIALPVSCGQYWRPAAGLMLALHWPFGPLPPEPFAFWTLVPSDACRYRHWLLSALVTVGAGWREKPLHQPMTIQRLIQCAVQTKPPVPA
jgi:hypothetical protein